MSTDVKISTNAWKAEPENDLLCRCCHAEGSFKNLYVSYSWLDVEDVVYANMLRECFNIELIGVTGSSRDILCAICYNCIQRLEDAVMFRRQVLKCEKRFQHVYIGCNSKDVTFEVPVKTEIQDTQDDIKLGLTACSNGTANESGIADGTNADDDDDGVCDRDETEYNHHDKGDAAVPATGLLADSKYGKRKKTKITSAKVKKKVQVERKPVKHAPALKDEQVIETIEGVINVVKRTTVKRHVDYKETDNIYQCLKCPFVSKTSNGIREHVRSLHLNIPKHTCPTCSKTFSTLATFTKHKLDEHEIDHRFKCNACDHAFNTKVQLRKHFNTFHMLGVKIKCKECDYETFSVESLYKHKFKHKTVKDYQCKYCRKAFVRKTTLQLHERIHTGDRRKVCSVCGQAFVQKASLNYHMTKYHPEVAF